MANRAAGAGDTVRNVVVVGGGAAGWLAAARLAARAGRSGGDLAVRVVESANVPTVGVGEGTWPTMRNTLREIGAREADFLRECDATFKQGARFAGWSTGEDGDAYYHPLNPPYGANAVQLPRFMASPEVNPGGRAFADLVDFQAALCEAGLAPKTVTAPEYVGQANYAYHLDAGRFIAFLRRHAIDRLGVDHVVGDVTAVAMAENGDISALRMADGASLAGDLFIDCTGFSARLIGTALGVGFVPLNHVLFADRAIALQLPYDTPAAPIACQTIATARSAGWIWDIGLQTRRGIGHVYSSAHMEDDAAEDLLRRYAGPGGAACAARRLSFTAGHRECFWRANCIAIGLSAGFLEPLEASALMLIETSINAIVDRLPGSRAAMPTLARQFNAGMRHHWRRIVEFLKLHYAISHRTDSAFWRDNTDPASFPDGLAERLALWRAFAPAAGDFGHAREVFSWPSYHYVLYGMGVDPPPQGAPGSAEQAEARRWVQRGERARARALAELPPHRALLDSIREHGLQTV